MKAIEIPTIGRETFHLGMHGMGKLRGSNRDARLHDLLERIVLGDFPLHLDIFVRHPATVSRSRSKPRRARRAMIAEKRNRTRAAAAR